MAECPRLRYSTPAKMAFTIGTTVGSYEILSLIGKGGMGEVYRARDSKLKREVAIKTLPDEFSRDPGIGVRTTPRTVNGWPMNLTNPVRWKFMSIPSRGQADMYPYP